MDNSVFAFLFHTATSKLNSFGRYLIVSTIETNNVADDMKQKKNTKRNILKKSKATHQLTLNNLPCERPAESKGLAARQNKQILIIRLITEIKADELTLKADFKLSPSKTLFSKIKANIFFDKEIVKYSLLDILHSFGPADEFQLKTTLDLKGINAGIHIIKAEMYEPSFYGKKYCYTENEVPIEYTPDDRKTTLRKIPIVKSMEGKGIAILSDSEKKLYREIDENQKKEAASNRDEW